MFHEALIDYRLKILVQHMDNAELSASHERFGA
jgi:hypothetical protein